MKKTIASTPRPVRFFVTAACLAAVTAAFPGCASFDSYIHKNFIYGEIDEIRTDEIVFCAGDRDQLTVGQLCNVYKSIKTRNHGIRNVTMGVIQITEFVDGTRARAKIVCGSIDGECRVRIME